MREDFVLVRTAERMDISIVVARILVEELSRREVCEERFCREAGLDLAALDDPLARLSFRTWNGVVGHALEVTNDPQLGLFVGSRTRAIALSAVVSLLASCATPREAAELLVRYAPLMVEGVRWALEVRNGVASLSCELPKALVHRAYEHEACLALAYSVMLSYRRNESPIEVCFEHRPTGPVESYRRTFDAFARFGADENAIRGDAEILDRRKLHADVVLHELLRARADSLLAAVESPDALPQRVRHLVEAHPSPVDLDMAEVARVMHLSERTLRRRLAAHGTSASELIDATVQGMACAALREPSASIKAVAFRLGFSELSPFYRAFKRWTGMTPAEYRDTPPTRVDGKTS